MAEAVGELADAEALSKTELLARIESVTLEFLRAVERGDDPELHLVYFFGYFHFLHLHVHQGSTFWK